jgi:hypothetical protein
MPAERLRAVIKAGAFVKTHRTDQAHDNPRAKLLLTFLMHQFISTAGIGILVASLAASLLQMLRAIPWQYPEHAWYQVFAYRPYFPVQTVTGLYFGWLLGRRLGHRAMIWVWILPALFLCYAVIAIPTLTPETTSSLLWSGTAQSWLTHYFGWGCRMKDRCFDQVLVTQPFYTATAYAVGARLAFIPVACGRGVP